MAAEKRKCFLLLTKGYANTYTPGDEVTYGTEQEIAEHVGDDVDGNYADYTVYEVVLVPRYTVRQPAKIKPTDVLIPIRKKKGKK